MNKSFKILLGFFIFLLFLGVFCVFSPFTEKYADIGYTAFTFDFFIGVILLSAFIQTKGLARLPERTVGAKVIEKNVKIEQVSSDDDSRTDYYYMVTFQSDHHDFWSFPLSIELYNALSPGDYGTLVYKVNKRGKVFFYSFLKS